MALKDFDIFKDMDILERSMSRMLEGTCRMARPSLSMERSWAPPVDVVETGEDVVVIMELAGAKKEDITVALDGEILRIAGVRRPPTDAEVTRLHQVELDFGEFERYLRLPGPLNDKKISAVYRDGFLTITISKSIETQKERTIEIREA